MDSISGVYDDLNEKMHDVDKTMWVSLLSLFLPTWTDEEKDANTLKHLIGAKGESICDLWRTDDDLHLQQKQPFVLRNGSGLPPRTSKLARPEGTSFDSPLTTTSNPCQWFVNINPSNFAGARPFPLQPWHHSPASFEEGGLPKFLNQCWRICFWFST